MAEVRVGGSFRALKSRLVCGELRSEQICARQKVLSLQTTNQVVCGGLKVQLIPALKTMATTLFLYEITQ